MANSSGPFCEDTATIRPSGEGLHPVVAPATPSGVPGWRVMALVTAPRHYRWLSRRRPVNPSGPGFVQVGASWRYVDAMVAEPRRHPDRSAIRAAPPCHAA